MSESMSESHATDTSDRRPSFSQIKREPAHRVFVNRSLQLSKIKFFGFDMDYTLALYKSPNFEILTFDLVIDQLIQLGYPKEIKNFVYDPTFPVRGLWYDKLYGNLLKVDTHGNILVCVHGFKFLKTSEIYKLYPNKYLNYDESRVYLLNTLFNLPEIYLLACMINYFTESSEFVREQTGVSNGDVFISFKAIFQDIRQAIDQIHNNGSLKSETLRNIDDMVVDDGAKLALLFDRMKENNAKVFLLTNSGYEYTDKIMGFLLNKEKTGRHWRSYFDYVLVDARKPLFFEEGTSLKEIDMQTGVTKFGTHSGPLRENMVYSGGNCEVFSKLIGSRGKDVLYVGDHIFGDIIKSKKERAWRTFLLVPELTHEMVIWHENRNSFSEMDQLDRMLSEKLVNYDSSSKNTFENIPDISKIKLQIQKCIHEMDMQYGLLGSLFRTGSRQTHFASQVTRFADIYAASHLNLLHYPFFYLFKSPAQLMPHESTVNPYEHIRDDTSSIRRGRLSSLTNSIDSRASPVLSSTVSALQNQVAAYKLSGSGEFKISEKSACQKYPETPTALTHHEDFDDDDEDSDESKNSTLNKTC